MATDESFKRPGSIPFKWEIRPGVPKTQLDSPSRNLHRSLVHYHHHQQTQQPQLSYPNTPRKPSTPPNEFFHQPQPDPIWTRSIRSAPQTPLRRSTSRSVKVEPTLVKRQPEIVGQGCFASPNPTLVKRQPEIVGQGCFASPNLLLRTNYNKKTKKNKNHKRSSDSEYSSSSDVESVSRFSSASSRRSASPLSSSFSSHWSSPRETEDSYWAGFGLF